MPATNRFGYPYALVVTPAEIDNALKSHGVQFRKRLLDPSTTLYAWMGQIATQDRSCRGAVARLAAFYAVRGHTASARTGAYAQARQKLDGDVVQHLCRSLARRLETECRGHWAIPGRPAFAVDGTVISGPDTKPLQREYPQHAEMAKGIGFPIMRLVLVFSLATGAILDLAIVPHKGEDASEHAAYRQIWPRLQAGDVVVGDRLYYSYWSYHALRARGIDVVCRKGDVPKLHGHPLMDVFGRDDRQYCVHKPMRPRWMTKREFARIVSGQPVRVTGHRYDAGHNRIRRLELISTFRSATVDGDALAELYRQRWNAELDIRAFKVDFGADILRCKTPEMLRKELWVTALAYNAVRALMAKAASCAGAAPRSLSLKGALQTIDAFSPRLDRIHGLERDAAVAQMLAAIASHTVGNRPDRVEPRLVKRRRKKIDLMTVPRDEARRLCRGGRYE